MKKDVVTWIKEEKILPILRNVPLDVLPDLLALFEKNEINILEVTANSQSFIETIQFIKEKYPHFMIGAGTVTSLERVKLVAELGVSFIVTPNVNLEVIAYAQNHQLGTIIGALTPSEIEIAYEAGADIVKIFPIGVLGTEYYRAVIGPLDTIPFLPTGGVSLKNIAEYRELGATGFGIGSDIVNINLLKEKKITELDTIIKEFVTLARTEKI
ncbi:bifunctional 4-hydroxy-2-oxoglutarate aldolase/2-dehydro-3-deoxy-phosphogluconate aldolase [Vagococcus sp.]|uniref:bifunctional 4-hydroxy-2-oxoglutarate aldolase/2-dehydro-3-deoxy-phosphogluconate aldolase n=1 Tax=Vagococcus sp. TaxID=1933889 RepID=UPI003F9823C3